MDEKEKEQKDRDRQVGAGTLLSLLTRLGIYLTFFPDQVKAEQKEADKAAKKDRGKMNVAQQQQLKQALVNGYAKRNI